MNRLKMNPYVAIHLKKSEKIKTGAYYTPEKIVNLVFNLVSEYLNQKDVVIFDPAGGCGAFIYKFKNYNYRIADIDEKATDFLRQHFDPQKVFHTNSLLNVSRQKFDIPEEAFLIIVGNPPYNDTTSEFRKNQKGVNVCDFDLYDRDIGISFFKMFEKLNAQIVCVLHPLSYLIKKTNFERLKKFKDNYVLKKSFTFPSSLFKDTGKISFPVTVSLYERDNKGMDYFFISNFSFEVLDSGETFRLSNFKTTDGIINKYPPRKKDALKQSPIGLYFYSFRDINSLKKNASFIDYPGENSVVVTLENFYQYAYLYAFKKLFSPYNSWLYGNLSPLLNEKLLNERKNLVVCYALKTHKLFLNNMELTRKITDFYGLDLSQWEISKIEQKLKKELNAMVK